MSGDVGTGMVKSAPTVVATPLHERLSSAAQEFRTSVDAVISEVPVAVPKPSEFERVLKLDRTLSSRLLRAVKLSDPLATLYRMPGLQGMRRMLAAAAEAGVDPSLIERASESLAELEVLVNREVGTWQDLGAALAGWLPDAREEFELANRQTVYRAMVNLKGLVAGVCSVVRLLHPATDGSDQVDVATVFVLYQLKRTRPGVPISIFSLATTPETIDLPEYTLDNELIKPGHEVPLLREFCSQPVPEFAIREYGDHLQYSLISEAVGIGSLVDVFVGQVIRNRYPLHPDAGTLRPTLGVAIDLPTRIQVIDTLMHEDVWPNLTPEPVLFDITTRGFLDPFDQKSEMQRVDLIGSYQQLGSRPDGLRVGEIARYTEVIEHVCDRLGWDRSRFRAYRWRAEYPLLGTQCSTLLSE